MIPASSKGSGNLTLVRRLEEPGLQYEVRRPPPGSALFPWVERYHSVTARRCRTAVERALPDWTVEIHFNLGPSGRHPTDGEPLPALPRRPAWVVGQRRESIFVAKEIRDCDHLVVRLRPCAAVTLLGVPARELSGELIDLDCFWGRDAERICDQLSTVTSPEERLNLLDRLLARRVERLGEPSAASRLCRAVAALPALSIGRAALTLGVSHRAVIDAFDQGAGLKPKAFARIGRLRRLLSVVEAVQRPGWAGLACQSGYHDQAHLIHEFRRLTGLTPEEYRRVRSGIGHGFVPHLVVSPAKAYPPRGEGPEIVPFS